MYHRITKASMKGSQLFIPDATSARPFRNIFQSSKKKKEKKNYGYRSGKNILYLFNRYCNDVFRAFFFFHIQSPLSLQFLSLSIVISARNCREREIVGSIQSDFKKLMIGIFMSRKEVMHTPRKVSYNTYVSTRIRFSPTTSVTWFSVFVKRQR